jgi:hypothetical protein
MLTCVVLPENIFCGMKNVKDRSVFGLFSTDMSRTEGAGLSFCFTLESCTAALSVLPEEEEAVTFCDSLFIIKIR